MFQLIASYPKSGNTYLRIFLAHYLTGNENLNTVGFPVFSSHANFPLYLPPRWQIRGFEHLQIVKTHEVGYNFSVRYIDRAVCIVRNPFDLVLSYARHMDISVDKAIRRLNKKDAWLSGSKNIYPQYISSWSNHVLSWLRQDSFPVLFVRYENLVSFPMDTFVQLLNFIGMNPDLKKVAASVAFSNFQNLKSREEKMLLESVKAGEVKTLTSKRSSPTKIAFKEARGSTGRFFNVGKYNQGLFSLTPIQAQQILKDHGQVMELLGYAKKAQV